MPAVLGTMEASRFDYELPAELIAQAPAEPRDGSRLLVLRRSDDSLEHDIFRGLPRYVRPGDVLVLNDSRVLPARLFARRIPQGGRVEVLLLHPWPPPPEPAARSGAPQAPGGDGVSGRAERWEVLVRPGRRAPVGQVLEFGGGRLEATVEARTAAGGRVLRFGSASGESVGELLHRFGTVPLPPYIHRPLADPERYQTVYARHEGSAAAPTAGLHFTPRLLDQIRERGAQVATLTLHVGVGTFRPVREREVEAHRMHTEFYRLPPETARAVERARQQGGRVWAVGTTVVRALESAAQEGDGVRAGSGWTDLFIYPGYSFRMVDVLVTNFHLPRSTLLMLVCAFAGTRKVLEAYHEAVRQRYRFYSFGDAMLILP